MPMRLMLMHQYGNSPTGAKATPQVAAAALKFDTACFALHIAVSSSLLLAALT